MYCGCAGEGCVSNLVSDVWHCASLAFIKLSLVSTAAVWLLMIITSFALICVCQKMHRLHGTFNSCSPLFFFAIYFIIILIIFGHYYCNTLFALPLSLPFFINRYFYLISLSPSFLSFFAACRWFSGTMLACLCAAQARFFADVSQRNFCRSAGLLIRF